MSLSGRTGTMSGIAISPIDSEVLSNSFSAMSGGPFQDFDLNFDHAPPVRGHARNADHEETVGEDGLRLFDVDGARQRNDLLEVPEESLHAEELRPVSRTMAGALD